MLKLQQLSNKFKYIEIQQNNNKSKTKLILISMIILLSLISFILYTLAAAHGSVANGIKMVGNAFQIHVDGRYMVGVNPHAMVVAGPVGGKPALT